MRKDGIKTRKKILTVCVHLFLEQGYKETTITQITEGANITRGSFQNLFPTKEDVLLDLVKTMFEGQFETAKNFAGSDLSPIHIYALETAIQLTLTELDENLRELYTEAYTLPNTSEYIYQQTTLEIEKIFSRNFPDYSESDFYEMEIGTAGLMRNYMAKKCGIHFPFETKLNRFLTAALRVYKVPEKEQEDVLAYIAGLDIKSIATDVMWRLFTMLEMKYDFKLSNHDDNPNLK